MLTTSACPARWMASFSSFIASAGEEMPSGANPPSSPTAVERPFSFSTSLSSWYVSAPMRSACAVEGQ